MRIELSSVNSSTAPYMPLRVEMSLARGWERVQISVLTYLCTGGAGAFQFFPSDVSCLWLRYGYEAELLALLEQLVRDMDRKIERQKERAIKDNAPREPNQAERAELDALQAREKGGCCSCTQGSIF